MITDDTLMELARDAARRAYCPYSKFRVGAAVLLQGRAVAATGCNVESASYGLTMCAERVAMFHMIGMGARLFHRMAVTCLDALAGSPTFTRMPCGACRQLMAEFAAPDAVVMVDGVGTFAVSELIPLAFRL